MATETAEKVKKIVQMADCDRAFVSKEQNTIIDIVNPATGLSWCYGKTLDVCREEYPDAEEMDIDEFCTWKAERQRTPITWSATTKAQYWEMLECLPPAAMSKGWFLVGEPYDHDAGNGQPRFSAYRQYGNTYETSSRPITRAEFHTAIA